MNCRSLMVIAMIPLAVGAQAPTRSIAITIDDLPVVSTRTRVEHRREMTKRLLGHLADADAPAIGFVNEHKLYAGDARDEQQIDLLRMWLAAGLELGNHTFSHNSLHTQPLAEYEADLLRGETITRELLAARGKPIRYFRHPFLHTGRTLPIKSEFAAFLQRHGYTIAPVTIDNADYIFSRAYDIAVDQGDQALMQKVGDAYVPYMERKLAYWERQAMRLFGREVPQTLLIHANAINADYLDDLIAMFKRRGYTCVDLETALKDDVYRLPDAYIGSAGISWLHRWALERGKPSLEPDEPTVPAFIAKLTGMTE